MWRRWFAAALWLTGVQPTALLVAVWLDNTLKIPSDSRDWLAFGTVVFLVCFLPMLGFGLLGLAMWTAAKRLAVAGSIVVAASGFVILTVCW
jgi:hypothetical protein